MERVLSQQFFEHLEKSNMILIALPEQAVFETVSAAFGLQRYLEQQGKQVTLAGAGSIPSGFGFLERPPVFEGPNSGLGGLVVTLNTAEHQLDELSYASESESVKIFLKAKEGSFSPADISVAVDQKNAYDLIITVGASSLDELGSLFTNNTDLFYSIPKVTIDTKAQNEYFGAVNIVDVTSAATGELLADLLLQNSEVIIPEAAATAFLASIISATTSFQDVQTTPRTLALAARLIEFGARQQDVVISLFKTKDFALLKLWGRVLARIKTNDKGLLYSSLNALDFSKTETGEAQLLPVFRELLDNVSGYQSIALLAETEPGKIFAVIAGLPHAELTTLLGSLTPEEPKQLPNHGTYLVYRVALQATDIPSAEAVLQNSLI